MAAVPTAAQQPTGAAKVDESVRHSITTGGSTPVDQCGHGTHVAGTLAGSGAMSNGLYQGAAVERLSRKGIVVVTAAGNMGINPLTSTSGYGGVGVPCNAPSAVCVGALDTRGTPNLRDDPVADFSSRGPLRFDLLAKPELVADGVNVVRDRSVMRISVLLRNTWT